MSDKPKPIVFNKIIKEMAEADERKANAGSLAIIGGEIDLGISAPPSENETDESQDAASKIKAFLQDCNLDQKSMPNAIWETVAGINMRPTTEILKKELQEFDAEFRRARIFGEGGDLSLRVDGNRLLWHFIGEKDKAPKITDACDFWDGPGKSIAALRCQENEKALLWGKNNGATAPDKVCWLEDRVRVADLRYPGMEDEDAERVRIVYNVYWHNGQPVFYWLCGLEEVPKEKDKNGEKNG